MKKNDRPNNLTIIYYTGHGSYQRSSESDAGYLKLHAYVFVAHKQSHN